MCRYHTGFTGETVGDNVVVGHTPQIVASSAPTDVVPFSLNKGLRGLTTFYLKMLWKELKVKPSARIPGTEGLLMKGLSQHNLTDGFTDEKFDAIMKARKGTDADLEELVLHLLYSHLIRYPF